MEPVHVPRESKKLGEVERPRTSVLCPAISVLCSLTLWIGMRLAIGRDCLALGFELEVEGISDDSQAGNNEVLSISRGVEAACGGSALCVRRKRIGSSA